LRVELDVLDGHLQRAAGHRALHEHGAGCRVDAIPVDLVQLVLGRLHLVSEAVLRADAHRLARRHRQRRLQIAREREQHALVVKFLHEATLSTRLC